MYSSDDATRKHQRYVEDGKSLCKQYAAFGFAGQQDTIVAAAGDCGAGSNGSCAGAGSGDGHAVEARAVGLSSGSVKQAGDTVLFGGVHINRIQAEDGDDNASMEMVLPRNQPQAAASGTFGAGANGSASEHSNPAADSSTAAAVTAYAAAASDPVTTGGREEDEMVEGGALSPVYMAKIAKYDIPSHRLLVRTKERTLMGCHAALRNEIHDTSPVFTPDLVARLSQLC